MKDPPSSYYLHPLLVISGFSFLFFGEFSQPGDKKKRGGWRIQQRPFLRFFFKNAPYLEKTLKSRQI
jgi:hypothetical protein